MNKVFLIFSLFTASFFFLFTTDVKAISYKDITLTDENLNRIDDNFFAKRNNVISYAREKNYYYYFTSSDVYFSNISEYFGSVWGYVPIVEKCKFVDNNLSDCQTFSDWVATISPNNLYLDLNIDIYLSEFSYTYHYNNYSYTFGIDNPLPSIYSLYNDITNGTGSENEQLLTLNNFYSVIIEKINYLANVFIDNYIYLFVITIFIIIFIFQLIFRRFL